MAWKFNPFTGALDETAPAGAGATTFVGLTDTPANYTGSAGLFAKVNAGATALEFGSVGVATPVAFAWGDATPAIIATISAGNIISSIQLIILESFNGVNAALSIGITGTPEFFMSASQCIPSELGIYEVNPGYEFTAEGTVLLFITPGTGASTGKGVILVDY